MSSLQNLNWRLFGVLAIPAAVASCVSTGTNAPANSGAASNDTPHELGRRIYRTKCAKCHAPEPVKRYSMAEWEELMPEMIEETRLDPAESAAVWTYIRNELQ